MVRIFVKKFSLRNDERTSATRKNNDPVSRERKREGKRVFSSAGFVSDPQARYGLVYVIIYHSRFAFAPPPSNNELCVYIVTYTLRSSLYVYLMSVIYSRTRIYQVSAEFIRYIYIYEITREFLLFCTLGPRNSCDISNVIDSDISRVLLYELWCGVCARARRIKDTTAIVRTDAGG